jgi:hypothetical protein
MSIPAVVRLVVLCAVLAWPTFANAVDAPAAPKAAPAALAAPEAANTSPLMRETRAYVAQVTEERNQLRSDNDRLTNQGGFLAGYALLITLVAGWLAFRQLHRQRPAAADTPDTDLFPASDGSTRVTVRKNATITIRNSATQQAEVVESVQTRTRFQRSEPTTNRHTRSKPASEAAAVPVAPPPASTTRVMRQVTTPTAGTASVPRPATVRVEHHSDRLEPLSVAVKPGTGAITRPTR